MSCPVSLTKKIAQGGFAEVYETAFDNEKFALKMIKSKNGGTPEYYNHISQLNEIDIGFKFDHPNIMRCVGIIDDSTCKVEKNSVILLYDLYDVSLASSIGKKLDDHKKRFIISSIANGLYHLHKNNYYHFDIKSDNILIKFDTNSIVISDFGMAKYIPPSIKKINSPGGTLGKNFLKNSGKMSPDFQDIVGFIIICAELILDRDVIAETRDELLEVIRLLNQPGFEDLYSNIVDLISGNVDLRVFTSRDDIGVCNLIELSPRTNSYERLVRKTEKRSINIGDLSEPIAELAYHIEKNIKNKMINISFWDHIFDISLIFACQLISGRVLNIPSIKLHMVTKVIEILSGRFTPC